MATLTPVLSDCAAEAGAGSPRSNEDAKSASAAHAAPLPAHHSADAATAANHRREDSGMCAKHGRIGMAGSPNSLGRLCRDAWRHAPPVATARNEGTQRGPDRPEGSALKSASDTASRPLLHADTRAGLSKRVARDPYPPSSPDALHQRLWIDPTELEVTRLLMSCMLLRNSSPPYRNAIQHRSRCVEYEEG
ncbi:hypothetical protein NG825_03630 [Xanthomonas sacchari]|uniref:hypothetical protein n=1 Tax=Xanthomonas sacchari TaxID=56458 RepID=UPI002254748C|nr:hypothetical protein [Xanthomonas sacchari]UYK77459.1 hypothetical protein NG825_03630 [Xanthomonas sacchari]